MFLEKITNKKIVHYYSIFFDMFFKLILYTK